MNGDMKMEMKCEEKSVYMWGYLPGALPQRTPILSPVEVRLPQSIDAGRLWTDVCGGGCGFAMAISGWLHSFFETKIIQVVEILFNQRQSLNSQHFRI